MSQNARSSTFLGWIVVVVAAFAACSGGGEDDAPSTAPTVDEAAQVTQAALSTSEAATEQPVPTNTRVAPPAEQPTRASGTLVVAASTDITQTGLLDVLTPMFESESGYDIEVLARPSADARAAAALGDADAALLSSEETSRAITNNLVEGDAAPVLRIDYVLVGPPDDPAQVGQQERLDDAFGAIAGAESPFYSRLDGSDTYVLELTRWPGGISPNGSWYVATGAPMAETLQAAGATDAYTFSDRWTFLSRRDALGLEILVDGDPATTVTYSLVVVDPATHPGANATAARSFAAFLARADVQQIIGEYGVSQSGEPAFLLP